MSKKITSTIFILSLLLTLQSVGQTVSIPIPDTNLRNCLKSRYPTTINPSGQLVISEAAKLTGTLNCTNYNISNADGVQYFTSLNSLLLLNNAIAYVPSLVNLQILTELDLSQNNLNELPDISKLTKLQTLSVQQNNLTILPDLSANNLLQTLVAHNNVLTDLPSLDRLTKLAYINVSHNNLVSLPNLDKLASLQTLYCWSNSLTSLPGLDSLKNLRQLHAFLNNLTEAPKLPKKNKISLLYLNDNKIGILQDYSYCDSLVKVRIYNNYGLTFREYMKLTTKSGYDTIFKLSPQQKILVGRKQSFSENDTIFLTTGIDQDVAGVSYSWYKNGIFFKTVMGDKLSMPKASFQDSGKYTCVLKHPAFSGFSLSTDTFQINILPCVEFGEISYNTTNINCMNTGTLTISGNTINTYSFELVGTNTGKTILSSTGKFIGLTEPIYKLTVKAKNGCLKDYPNPILINQKECEEAIISPDSDGNLSSYYFAETGKVIIYDKRGDVVKSLSIPAEWNGTSEKGKVSSGFYVADINNGKRLVGITVLY